MFSQLQEEHRKEIGDVREQATKKARIEALESTAKDFKDKEEQILALRKRAEQAEEQELAIRREKRELEESKRKFELEKQRQFDEERGKIRDETLKEAQERHELKDKERDMVINNLKKSLADAQRKAQQGSQQLQGEVLELGLEGALRQEFPYDNISEVPKGIRGADIIQTVCTQRGASCGTIVWELKNTKNWIASWVEKLKNDQRELKANLAVIVSSVLPPNTNGFGRLGDILVCELKFAIPLAQTLREQLIGIHTNEQAHQGKSGKAEAVYDYLLSNNFRQRIEVWVEHFKDKQETLNKEKAYFVKKWAKEEQDLNKLRKSAIGLYGDLEGITGNALPKISYLELPESTENGEL